MRRPLIVGLAIAVAIGAGCETTGPKPAPSPAPSAAPAVAPPPPPVKPAEPPKPMPPPKSPAEIAVDEGVALYDAGDFNGAIKSLLGNKEIWSGPSQQRVRAHKYVAFSYCVTGRRTLCRQQFADALKLDPQFELEPAERAHPIWGPQYEAARKAAVAPAASGPATRPPAKPPAPTSKPPAQ